MKKIKLTKHLQNRIKIRKLSIRLINNILKSPKLTLFDRLNKTKIPIGIDKGIHYIVAYVENKETIKVITIHPIKQSQIKNRIKKKRWTKRVLF